MKSKTAYGVKRQSATAHENATNQGLVAALTNPGPRRRASKLYGLASLPAIGVEEVIARCEALGFKFDGTTLSINIATMTILVRDGRLGI